MDFLSDDDITNISLEQFMRPQLVTFEINQCCGKAMIGKNSCGTRIFECEICNKYITTTESFDSKVEYTIDYERPNNTYGLLSGKAYISKMKNDIKIYIKDIIPRYSLTESQIVEIIDMYFLMRNSNIQRAAPRKGIICACINKVTKIPIDLLSSYFNLNQSHITSGQKKYNIRLTPFALVTVDDLIDEEFKRIDCNAGTLNNDIKNIIRDLVKLSLEYYIAIDTTIKTKIAGILLYLYDTKMSTYDIDKICKLLNICENTIYKFYDIFMISLHMTGRVDKLYQPNQIWRREQLCAYLEYKSIPIMPIINKKRLDKFRSVYFF